MIAGKHSWLVNVSELKLDFEENDFDVYVNNVQYIHYLLTLVFLADFPHDISLRVGVLLFNMRKRTNLEANIRANTRRW